MNVFSLSVPSISDIVNALPQTPVVVSVISSSSSTPPDPHCSLSSPSLLSSLHEQKAHTFKKILKILSFQPNGTVLELSEILKQLEALDRLSSDTHSSPFMRIVSEVTKCGIGPVSEPTAEPIS